MEHGLYRLGLPILTRSSDCDQPDQGARWASRWVVLTLRLGRVVCTSVVVRRFSESGWGALENHDHLYLLSLS